MTDFNHTDKWFIFDLDGTLANIDARRKLAKDTAKPGKNKMNWDTFFNPSNIGLDKPNHAVIKMAQILAESGHMIAIFSGRSQRMAWSTKSWLVKNNVPWCMLKMRPIKGQDAFTPDDDLKQSWLDDFADDVGKHNILGVFDDRKKVVDMWRKNGLTCFQVADGDF